MRSPEKNPESDPITSLIMLSDEVEKYKQVIDQIRQLSTRQNHREILMYDQLASEIDAIMARAAETTSEITNPNMIPVAVLRAKFNEIKAGIENP